MPPVVMPNARLILASASPRRLSLLREAGFSPIVHPSNLDERAFELPGILPAELATRLALAKAQAVAEEFTEDVVLGADTVVAFGDQFIGKPADAADARRIITLLAGTTHLVITGVAVVCRSADHRASACIMSAVRMRLLSSAQIEAHVASRAWEGKAGGYGIQDQDPFVDRLTGCLTNIVGLPIKTTVKLLAAAGIEKEPPAG
jgi:septum formation protein